LILGAAPKLPASRASASQIGQRPDSPPRFFNWHDRDAVHRRQTAGPRKSNERNRQVVCRRKTRRKTPGRESAFPFGIAVPRRPNAIRHAANRSRWLPAAADRESARRPFRSSPKAFVVPTGAEMPGRRSVLQRSINPTQWLSTRHRYRRGRLRCQAGSDQGLRQPRHCHTPGLPRNHNPSPASRPKREADTSVSARECRISRARRSSGATAQ